jgi:hypothetical protein
MLLGPVTQICSWLLAARLIVHRNRERFYAVFLVRQAFLVHRTTPVTGVVLLHRKQDFLVRIIDVLERTVLQLLISNKLRMAC